MKKFLTISTLIGVTLLSSMSVYAQETESNVEIEPRFKNCTSWTTDSISETCDTTDGCGFLWQEATRVVVRNQSRVCSDNGDRFTETRVERDKDGCC